MQIELTAQTPFIFETTVRSHGWYQLAPNVWDSSAHSLTRPEQLASGKTVLLTITGIPQGLRATFAGRLNSADLNDLRARLTWMFALDADFSAFYEQADHEPRLRHCRAQARGRFLRSPTLFEDVVKMVFTTNIQWSGTIRLSQKLVDHFGAAIEQDAAGRKTFPSAQTIARARESTLRTLGLGYRAPYVLKLARGVVDGSIRLETLTHSIAPTDLVRKQLIALPGIGPYAAAALLALLGKHDYIPVDTEAVSAVGGYFYGGKKVSEREINAVFEQWGRHRALAYWFWDYSGEHQSNPSQSDVLD
jgi:3-methyladenine DNA glycosylase/8-oxoguanine DNA glycosylase